MKKILMQEGFNELLINDLGPEILAEIEAKKNENDNTGEAKKKPNAKVIELRPKTKPPQK